MLIAILLLLTVNIINAMVINVPKDEREIEHLLKNKRGLHLIFSLLNILNISI
jgi:hypothetical protein